MPRMKPNQFRLILIFISILCGAFYMLSAGSSAEADTNQPIEFTVPTRTPTPNSAPSSPEPTQSSGGSSSGGQGNPSQPVSTEPPSTAPTAETQPNPTVPPVTLAPTPENGFITPEECGIPYYVAAFGETNVRQYPDPTSEIIGGLVFYESRPIVARSGVNQWWRIVLANGTQGWVSDEVGQVSGVLTSVPIVDQNGIVMTNPTWQPTPNPRCAGISVQPISSPQSPEANQTAPPPNAEPPAQEVVEQQNATSTLPPTAQPDPETITEGVETQAPTENSESDSGNLPTESESVNGSESDQNSGAAVEATEIAAISASTDSSGSDPSLSEGSEGSEAVVSGAALDETSDLSGSNSISSVESQIQPASQGPGSIMWIILVGIGLILAGGVAMFAQRRPVDE